jgi:coenzyme F420-reducing hydrogenase delta subunit
LSTHDTEHTKLFIFYCSNNFSLTEFNNLMPADEGIEYKNIGLPCSGKANLQYLVKAFEKGADGLILIACPHNECRYLQGNLRSPKRAEGLSELLDEIGLGGERVAVITSGKDAMDRVVSEVVAFRDKIKAMRVPGAVR